MVRSLLFVSLSVLSLGPCSKPPPPADAAKSCSTFPPYKLADSGDGGTEVVFTMKNTDTVTIRDKNSKPITQAALAGATFELKAARRPASHHEAAGQEITGGRLLVGDHHVREAA